MDRTVEIDTGESVAFSYELAGLGSRFLALFIDAAIQAIAMLGIIFTFFFLFTLAPWRVWFVNVRLTKIGDAVLLAAALFTTFMLFFGYFILFEWLWGGRTPGKRVIGIRVVRDGGFPLDFMGSLIRNLVRILEFSLGLYIISGVSAMLSAQNKRLGDFAAGTLVVRDVRFERFSKVKDGDGPADDSALRDVEPRERDLIRKYAARRDALEFSARTRLAAEIAERVRPRLAANFDHLSDDQLLMHLARTAF